MTRNSKVAAIAVAAGAVLVLGGCGGGGGTAAGASSSAPASGTPAGTPSGTSSGQEMSPVVTLEDAGATAVKRVSGGTLVSIELEDGGAVWETQVVAADGTEHAIDVATSGGKVTSAHVKQESAAKRAEHRKRVSAAKLGYAAAAGKMRAAVPGGKITELNLDDHRGTTVWEGDVHAGNVKHEVRLNAASGTIITNRTASGD